MEEGRIHYRLDLMLRVMDATTGKPVTENDIRFFKDDKLQTAHGRGEGCFIFMNCGRENCLMRVEVFGFLPQTVKVDYEKMEDYLPAIDVFLIPSEKQRIGRKLLTLQGKISGLVAVEAIHPGRPVSSVLEYDSRKHTMTVFAPNRRLNLQRQYYGVFYSEDETFEDIIIKEELSNKKVLLKEPISRVPPANAPLCAITFGQVEEDGRYILAVPEDGKDQNYLVKFVVDGDTRYKKIDLHELSEVTLD